MITAMTLVVIVLCIASLLLRYFQWKLEEAEKEARWPTPQKEPKPFCRGPRDPRLAKSECVRPALRKDGRLDPGELGAAQSRWLFLAGQEEAMANWEKEWNELFPPKPPKVELCAPGEQGCEELRGINGTLAVVRDKPEEKFQNDRLRRIYADSGYVKRRLELQQERSEEAHRIQRTRDEEAAKHFVLRDLKETLVDYAHYYDRDKKAGNPNHKLEAAAKESIALVRRINSARDVLNAVHDAILEMARKDIPLPDWIIEEHMSLFRDAERETAIFPTPPEYGTRRSPNRPFSPKTTGENFRNW